MKVNLIILPISAHKGMAGTARLRNFVKYLPKDQFDILNLVDADKDDTYEFCGINVLEMSTDHSLRTRWKRMTAILKERYLPNGRNILYFYDISYHPLHIMFLKYGKRLGYKVVYDIVEDYRIRERKLSWRGNLRLMASTWMMNNLEYIANGAVAISHHLYQEVCKSIPSPIHIPISFDPEYFDNYEGNTGGTQEEIVVFYGGTFGAKDGMEYLIQGFDAAREEEPRLQLWLTGKASVIDAEQFKRIYEKARFKDSIRNFGYVSYEDYQSILKRADILCMTRRDSEFANAGFPFKLGEYLATGKPVIVSRLKEVEKYLEEGDCYFVKPESSAEIAEAIQALCSPVRREALGDSGRQKAFENFNASILSEKLANYLMEV